MDKDYCCYIHTDSCFFSCYHWLEDNGVTEQQWNKLSKDQKIKVIQQISEEVANYINEKSFEETQKQHYNSQVDDFKIVFEIEKIALSGLFKEKARYATWTLLDGGKWKDSMSITGLEIIRSDSPEIVKPMVKNVLEMILKQQDENDIRSYIKQCKKQIRKCGPEEIAENKGLNKLDKYLLPNFKWIKGTPHQLKGLANFRYLVNKLDIEGKYEEPHSGNKAKIVYIKKNPYNIESLSFIEWPKEFNDIGICVDYEKMVQNNLIKKVKALLELINKEHLLTTDQSVMNLFE